MLTRLIVVINSQYKYVSNYVVYLKVIHCYVNYILILGLFFFIRKGQEIIFSIFTTIRWLFGLTIFYSNLHLISTEIKPNRQPSGSQNHGK